MKGPHGEIVGAAGIASLFQAMPQFHHAQHRIPAAYVMDQLQFCLGVLVWVAVGPSGLTGQGIYCSIPTSTPEIDIGPTLVIFPAGMLYAMLFRVFHEGLSVPHVLCYTGHEGYGLLSVSWCVVTQLYLTRFYPSPLFSLSNIYCNPTPVVFYIQYGLAISGEPISI